MRGLIGSYVLVPLAAVGLLILFHAHPLVAAGFPMAAVCPGAPYGPPFTGLAKPLRNQLAVNPPNGSGQRRDRREKSQQDLTIRATALF